MLEQSWRLGGASPAEIGALEAFAADPSLRAVTVSSHEVYGPHRPPSGAIVYFQEADARVGLITKYSTVDAYEYSSQRT